MNYQLKKWIPENKLVKDILASNPIHKLYKGKNNKSTITYFDFRNKSDNKSKDPEMIDYFDQHIEEVNWNYMLSNNPKGYILGMKYFDIIPNKYKPLLCRYVEAFDFVIQQWEKIGNGYKWFYLCQNPKAIDFLEKHQENIDWYSLSINPGIYEYNYKEDAKIRMNIIRMELMEKTWHPNRCMDWCF